MTALALRDYQHAVIDAVEHDLADSYQRVAVVLPTGTGKTVTFAHMAARLAAQRRRTLVLAHRDELVSQAARKLVEVQPDLRVGVVKAERDEIDADVVVASVQTLASGRGRRMQRLIDDGPPFARVIVDECHHAVAESYRMVLEEIGCFDADSNATAVGFTATLGRGDGVALGKVWERVSYEMDILDAIRAGHLIDVRGIRVTVKGLDLDRVARSHGDYQDEAMGRAMIDSLAPEAIAKAYREHAADRQGIVFAPSVEMAHATAAALTAAGIPSESVWGAMPIEARRLTLKRFYHGDVQVLSNCMVLTEGFDAPQASCVVIARPTSSAPLYVQMVGRVLRPYPGQREALVLDVVGVGARHRLAGMADLAGVEVGEAKTLVEAVAEAEESERQLRAQRIMRNGELAAREFDLFGESRRAWLRTRRGTWFLDVAGWLIALAPGSEPGLFHVAKIPLHAEGGSWLREDQDLSYAMAWGEQFAAEARKHGAREYTSRSAGWRREVPAAGQRAKAEMLGIAIGDGA